MIVLFPGHCLPFTLLKTNLISNNYVSSTQTNKYNWTLFILSEQVCMSYK